MNWWNGLTGLQQVFATFAFPATLILLIQFVLLLFGLSGEDGGDDVFDTDDLSIDDPTADISEIPDVSEIPDISEIPDDGTAEAPDAAELEEDGPGDTGTLRLFSLRSLVAFFSIGGWTGVFAIDLNAPPILAIIIAFAAGSLALYFVAWSIHFMLRMQHSGNVKLENAIGKEGQVYLTIPENGVGKVNVIIQDRLCEINATTRAGRDIKTGEKITVMGVVSDGLLLVAPYTAPDGSDVKKIEEVIK